MDYFIRPIKKTDVDQILDIRLEKGVMENITTIPSEMYWDNEKIKYNLSNNHHSFVAVIQDDNAEKIIGEVMLYVYPVVRKRHSGAIGITVSEKYHKMGVGTSLLTKILDLADNYFMLTRVELTVIGDNFKAINLYKKFGFVEEATKVKAFIRDGQLVDEILMGRIKE